ncbi:MAG: hypothetical protein PVH68_19325 [Armatimonadota bacterium]|jgi:hypothetical protein
MTDLLEVAQFDYWDASSPEIREERAVILDSIRNIGGPDLGELLLWFVLEGSSKTAARNAAGLFDDLNLSMDWLREALAFRQADVERRLLVFMALSDTEARPSTRFVADSVRRRVPVLGQEREGFVCEVASRIVDAGSAIRPESVVLALAVSRLESELQHGNDEVMLLLYDPVVSRALDIVADTLGR